MESITWRDMSTDALRYWEPRRLIYNALLVAVCFGCAFVNEGGFGRMLRVDNLLLLLVLAVLANVAYCAAYVADLFLQFTHFREARGRWRLLIVTVGFTFAAALTYFFSEALFGGLTSPSASIF